MDSKLIDKALIELLQLPEEQRTPEKIHSNLALAATAAGITLDGTSPLQKEHMKLAAAVGLLTADMGDSFTHRTQLRIGPDLEGLELYAAIEARNTGGQGPRWVAFGSSAARVLASLRHDMEQHGKALEQRPSRRLRSSDPLRLLPRGNRQ